jgi:ferrous iron transport protein A
LLTKLPVDNIFSCVKIYVSTYLIITSNNYQGGANKMNNIQKPLSSLPIGATGRVAAINLNGITKRRLLDLGFVPGTKIEVLRRSPAGDPTAYYIRGATIALRAEEANSIFIFK